MTDNHNPKGPYVVWADMGYEGWHPLSYATLKEALESHKWAHEWVITKPVEYEITECQGQQKNG
jgi:hypothetical protein